MADDTARHAPGEPPGASRRPSGALEAEVLAVLRAAGTPLSPGQVRERLAASGQPTTIYVANDQGPNAIGLGIAVPIVAMDGSLAGMVAIIFDQDHIRQRLDGVFSRRLECRINRPGNGAADGDHRRPQHPARVNLHPQQREKAQQHELAHPLAEADPLSDSRAQIVVSHERLRPPAPIAAQVFQR